MTGVYCKLTAETEVHITVYAPYNFIRNSSEVYFNKDKDAEVKTDRNKFELQISQYRKSPLALAKSKNWFGGKTTFCNSAWES